MRIAITCPIYVKNGEHLKYLDFTTHSLYSKEHDLMFIPVENYIHEEFRPIAYKFKIHPDYRWELDGRENQSVSKAWNLGIEEAGEQGADYVLVINTDIVLKSNAIDRLVAFAEAHPEAVMWTMAEWSDLASIETCPEDENYSEHPHFSCFMVKPSILSLVGRFDENFKPAYCEDGDYHARMSKMNLKAYVYGGARFYHFGSRTIKSDAELWVKNSQTFPLCQEYFLKKWGHPVLNEPDQQRAKYYDYPFNDPTKGLKDW